MMIRFFDLLISLSVLLLLLPFFLVICIIIIMDSRGGPFYKQWRVGKNGKEFKLIKFRTMIVGAQKHGGLTIGVRDSRITKSGHFLRRYKLDELPQLINVLAGDMGMVGPRPEIRKYVGFYTPEQMNILSVRPGITDWASIEYISENEILGNAIDPEKEYIDVVLPAKIRLNRRYIENRGLREYFKILFITAGKILRG